MKPPSIMDVEENKMGKLMATVKKSIAEGKLDKYSGYIERTIEEMNSVNEEGNYVSYLDFAAAMLRMISDPNNTEATTKAAEAPVIEEADSDAEDGFVRLFINVGSKDKIMPGNIVQSIASTTGLPGKLIGAIDIFDNYTFVEVPREYAHKVLESMKNYTLKGRKVNIERSNKRPVVKRHFDYKKR
jgi:ATP-dependent RNA helicase DeaD